MNSTSYKVALKTSLLSILILLALAGSFWVLSHFNLQATIEAYLPKGPLGAFALFLLLSAGTSIGLPRQIAAASAGYIFSFPLGFALATFATLCGCWMSYTVSNRFLSKLLIKRFPIQANKLSQFISQETFIKTLIIRFLPAGSLSLIHI